MKKRSILIISSLMFTSVQFYACKSDKSDKNMDDTTALKTQEPTPRPQSVSTDDDLNNKIKGILPDYPGVTAAVSGGKITLTGSIDRAKLPQLMKDLNALNPQSIDNDLSVK